jgi:hypothetical protein
MKKYNVELLDIAKQDVKEVRLWYKIIQKELGKRFTADLKKTLIPTMKCFGLNTISPRYY